MKNALILLAVVALVLITLGAFNREASIDVDYVFGVWRSVNVFWLFLMAAGVVLAAGLLGASLARAQGWRERGKLEKELLEVYRRLRTAEAKVEAAAGAAGVAAAEAEADTMAAAAAEGSAATAVSPPEEAPTAVSGPEDAATRVAAPDEAPTVVGDAQAPPPASAAGEGAPGPGPTGPGADADRP